MDCIINPKTGRAVKKTSALGKKLLKSSDKTLTEDCIINPKTGRAVSLKGAIGRRLMKQKNNEDYKPKMPTAPKFSPASERVEMPSFESSTPTPKRKKYDFGKFKTPPKYSSNTPPRKTSLPNKKFNIPNKPNKPNKPLKQSTQNFDEIEEEEIVIQEPSEKSKSTAFSMSPNIYLNESSSGNKYSLDKRIKLYNKAKIYLDKISEKECITRVKSESREFMTLSNMLFMDKKIGTESAYGAIYLSSVKNVPDLSVVSKLTQSTKENLTELIIMEELTEKLLKTKKTKHFPLLYTTHICPDLKEKLALVSVNELCNGDLKMLVEDPSYNDMKPETIANIIYQIFISLITFHNFGYLHNDTHWGNFLYQNNSEEGYYEYQWKKDRFFIPSCPYNIMLYDFGMSKKLKNLNKKECYREIMRPLPAFQPKDMRGWNSGAKKRDINDKIEKIIYELFDISYFGGKNANTKNDVFVVILEILNNQFGDMIFKTTLNKDDIILNDEPFIIA